MEVFCGVQAEEGNYKRIPLVYPRYFDKRARAQQVKYIAMQAAWRDACKTAVYGGVYHLRDLRKKG